ncbi:sulfotransferase 1A2-like [Saccostrea cucullata]|uniref:sulfotransferase 1A2-like n=1 Tax=Saccostrea cuccullata TaxID=36930 RepID=UPI002ED2DBFE
MGGKRKTRSPAQVRGRSQFSPLSRVVSDDEEIREILSSREDSPVKYSRSENERNHFETETQMEVGGNHWLNAIVPRLQNSSLDTPHKMTEKFLEFISDLQELETVPSPRIMTSHLPVKYTSKDINGKIFYSIRNPKDVAVSAFHHYTTDPVVKDYVHPDWNSFLEDVLRGECYYGSWFEREKEWEQAAQQNPEKILIVYYEDLKKTGMETMHRISSFLRIHDPAFLQAVYDEFSKKEKLCK